MKPDGPVARAGDYSVRVVGHAAAAAFAMANHYSKTCSNTSVYAHGLFRGESLVGVALWMPPTNQAAASVSRDWRSVLALSKFVLLDGEPKNAESLFLSRCIKLIRREGIWKTLLTYADGGEGHLGTIYRATNWTFVGETKPEARWVDAAGKHVSKLATKSRTKREMLRLGYRIEGRYTKSKFIYKL